MKNILLLILISVNIFGNFDFKGCSGSGTFEQQIEAYKGDYEKVVKVGDIPVGIEGLHIKLISNKDVDIRLYGENEDKIVHWPKGILNTQDVHTASYKGMQITYSGYNGVKSHQGHEYIDIPTITSTSMTMKVFGYKAGYATVNYSWTGKEGCTPQLNGSGNFKKIIHKESTSLVGTIPPNIKDLDIQLKSSKDLDIQLYAMDGTAIVSWKPKGLLSEAKQQSINYAGIKIEWSGYNGTNNNKGDEYIKISGKTSEMLVMKVYGYESGEAKVSYHWGKKIVTKFLPLLLLRIEFNDYKFQNNATIWHKKIFGQEESELNHYYNEVSYHTFQFTPAKENNGINNDGIITVTLNENHPNTQSIAKQFLSRLNSALALADPYIDFSKYDKNANHAISRDELQIMFIVAGGEASTGMSPAIWAHQWCMYGKNANAPTHDDVKLMNCQDNGVYSLFGERHRYGDATIGVIAHELGHAVFSLPDLYDTDYSSKGIGIFGLMGFGSWTSKLGDIAAGQTPVHMTGWSKIKSGFIKPTKLTTSISNLKIHNITSKDYEVYQLNTGKDGEYFLIENRVLNGYDRGLNNLQHSNHIIGGLSILHIDDNYKVNSDETHKLVDIEEANHPGLDSRIHKGDIHNLFFKGNSTTFNATSSPNSKRYDGQSSGISIKNISNSAETMTVDITIN